MNAPKYTINEATMALINSLPIQLNREDVISLEVYAAQTARELLHDMHRDGVLEVSGGGDPLDFYRYGEALSRVNDNPSTFPSYKKVCYDATENPDHS